MSRRTRRRLAYTAGNGFGAAGGTPARQPARTPALPSAIPSTKHKAEVSDTDLDPDISDRTAGVPPAVAGASRPRFGDVKIRDRGALPPWEKEGATYFITFKLAGSLPQAYPDRNRS